MASDTDGSDNGDSRNIMEKMVMMVARAAVAAMTAASEKGGAVTTTTINHSGIRKTNHPPTEIVTIGLQVKNGVDIVHRSMEMAMDMMIYP